MLSGQVISTCYLLILGVGAAPADGAEADRWSLEEEEQEQEQEYGEPNMEHEFDMELKEASFPFQKFPASYLKKALAEGVDWTLDKRGVVTSPKNQGHHGYCGTFSRVAAAEGQYVLHTGQPARNFSVEQQVECNGSYYDGKDGGFMTWEDYPYIKGAYKPDKKVKPPCKFDKSKVVKNYGKGITGSTSPSKQGEDQAAAFLFHNGPVPCAINAKALSHKYRDHDMPEPFVNATACKKVKGSINHSVLCVGFGTDPVKGPYWKIKNSWGTHTSGKKSQFIKLARGVRCGKLGGTFGSIQVYGPVAGYYEASEDVIV